MVAKLLADTENPRDLVALIGYFGPSKKPDHVRLYTGLDFRTYYEVPKTGVVHTEPVNAKDENSPTRVMLDAQSTVELVQTSTQSGPAAFLAGAITGTHLPPAASVDPTQGVQPFMWSHHCHTPRCPHTTFCGHFALGTPAAFQPANFTTRCITQGCPPTHGRFDLAGLPAEPGLEFQQVLCAHPLGPSPRFGGRHCPPPPPGC